MLGSIAGFLVEGVCHIFTQKSNTKVVSGIVRLSYANVWEPDSINGSNPKYSVSLIIPKSGTKTIATINAAVDAAIKERVAKFGGVESTECLY